jgi:hypothetical protein
MPVRPRRSCLRWAKSAKQAALGCGLAAIFAGSCSTTEHVYKMYGGAPRADADISVIGLHDATGARSADVERRAGHKYSLHCDRTTGYGYQTFQWISDDTEGRIVAGKNKP